MGYAWMKAANKNSEEHILIVLLIEYMTLIKNADHAEEIINEFKILINKHIECC